MFCSIVFRDLNKIEEHREKTAKFIATLIDKLFYIPLNVVSCTYPVPIDFVEVTQTYV